MLDEAILRCKELSPAARVVALAIAMESYGCEIISISQSALAKAAGINRTTAGRAIRELVQIGLLAPDGEPAMQVQSYRLLPPLYRGRKPKPASPRIQLQACLCGKACVAPPCRACRRRSEVRTIVQAELAKGVLSS